MIICENEQGEVVGELNVHVGQGDGRVYLRDLTLNPVTEFPRLNEPYHPVVINDIVLLVERRDRSIIVDYLQQASMRGAGEIEHWVRSAMARHIPAGADVRISAHQEPVSGNMIYRADWQVVVIPNGMSERVFDFPQFTPR